MNVEQIREYCLSFPGATEKLQWGDSLCFKIKAKLFAVMGLDRQRLTFKCTPEAFAELIERDGIRVAPHVGRYHWVMLERLDALPGAELKELIARSYEMVVAKVPKKRAPKTKATKKKSRVTSGSGLRNNRKKSR